MSRKNPVICFDCKHLADIGTCIRGRYIIRYNLVTGGPEYGYRTFENAEKERASRWPWRCGRKGRNFEPKKSGY